MLSPGSRDLIEREILNDKTAQVRRVQAQDLSTHTLGYQPDIRLSKHFIVWHLFILSRARWGLPSNSN